MPAAETVMKVSIETLMVTKIRGKVVQVCSPISGVLFLFKSVLKQV